jgi:hypothetical protein
MRLRSFSALLVAAALALAACSTIDSRIRRQQALFDSYPPNVQHHIRNGVIEVGYTPEMVVMALGEPDRKVEVRTDDGLADVWTYRKSVPGFSVGMGTGGYVGSGVGLGTGVSVGEPGRTEDQAVVEFWDGRVARFQALPPR